MKKSFMLVFISVILLVFIGVSYASDLNSTESFSNVGINASEINKLDVAKNDLDNLSSSNNLSEIAKSKPIISIDSNKVKIKDAISIHIKGKDGKALKLKKLTASVGNKRFNLITDSGGDAKLRIDLPAGNYKLTVTSKADKNFTYVSKSFNINVLKLSTRIEQYSNFVLIHNYYYVFLKDECGNPVTSKRVILKVNGKTFTRISHKNGKIGLKAPSSSQKLVIFYKFSGNAYLKASSKKVTVFVNEHRSLNIGNSKLLTNGYLRVYLKDSSREEICKKTIKITVSGKTFYRKTTFDGFIVLKPKVKEGRHKVMAKFGKYYVTKIIRCYKGNVKDPLKDRIPLRCGVPDVDVMAGRYVLADGSGTYKLTKAQYREVLKRDSYCLFLYNKLPKYTFFKSKAQPNTYHIIKREKWNVIEKEINRKLVDANRHNYWPDSITVSLRGRSYSYPEVRDIQDTSYTCGPTSCSMCCQVLKNYLCESYLASASATTRENGTACSDMIKALEKKNFKCYYYYRNSFNKALTELKKGGCALVFHTKNHYVAILDISRDGKKVLVSNSYGSYYDIPSEWLSVEYMKTRYYKNYDDGLIVKLNYHLRSSLKNQISSYYFSMAPNWTARNTVEVVS